MPSSVTVHIEGLRELGERMRNLAADVSTRAARSATNAAAQVIKKEAVHNIEAKHLIDTGSLHDAVIVKRIPSGQSGLTSEHIVTVRTRRTKRKTKTKQATAWWGGFAEFGTVKEQARPWLRPAFDTKKSDALDAMVDKLNSAITKAGG